MKSPVVLMNFNRPDFTSSLIMAVQDYRPEKIYFVVDGPRSGASHMEDVRRVSEVRRLAGQIDWPCQVVTIFNDENLGVRKSFFNALDYVFSIEEFAIILEDDCLPCDEFFNYVDALKSEALSRKSIGIICGFNPAPSSQSEGRGANLMKSAFIWGWASSAHTWLGFQEVRPGWNPQSIEAALSSKRFASKIEHYFFMRLVRKLRKLDTWDVQFASYLRVKNKLNVVPKVNLVSNVGHGHGATHTAISPWTYLPGVSNLTQTWTFPESDKESHSEVVALWRRKVARMLLATFASFFRNYKHRPDPKARR